MRSTENRRNFLYHFLSIGITSAGGISLLNSCKSARPTDNTAKTAKPKNESCDDLTGISPTDVEKRKALGYTNLSPMPDSQCDNCKLWVPAKEGSKCGGCLLFAGPVSPEGHCTYWAPRV